jgi:hypothetical protein
MPETKIKEKLIEKIKSGEIKMKPKHYFVLGSVVLGLGTASVFMLATFVTNMIFYRIRVHNTFAHLKPEGAGEYTGHRILMFLCNLPWEPIIITLGLLGSGAFLLKKYDISYRKSFGVMVLATILAVVLAAYTVDRTGVNEKLGRKPGMKRLYMQRETTLISPCKMFLMDKPGKEVKGSREHRNPAGGPENYPRRMYVK